MTIIEIITINRPKDDIEDALFEICSTHNGCIFHKPDRLPLLRIPAIVECTRSLNKCPPSKGIIGIKLVKPRRIFTQISQKKRLARKSNPEIPRIDANQPSSAANIVSCAG